jgi:polysaccharide biosynthesis protein PslH
MDTQLSFDGTSRAATGSGARRRVLFIVHRTPFPPNKGDKVRSFWELECLSRHCDVDLFGFFDDPQDEEYFDRLHSYCRLVYLEKLSPFWSRTRASLALFSKQPFTVAFFYSKRMQRQIQSAMAGRDYDAIMVFSSSMAQYVESSAHPCKILDLVDVDSDKWRQYARHSKQPFSWLWAREARLLAAYETELVKRFTTTLVCTESEQTLLRMHATTGDIRVLQNFLDIDSYNPATIPTSQEIRSWQPYVILSGSMDYFPNIDAAGHFYRDIFPLIRRQCPNLRFVVAGRNPHPAVQKLAENPTVCVTGSVPDMKPYIAGAAAAVVPMRIARGVQNKIMEALALGVPVVSTKKAATALPSNVQCLLRVADPPEEFAREVVRIVRDVSVASRDLRSALKKHFEDLDLNGQLADLICARPSPWESPS